MSERTGAFNSFNIYYEAVNNPIGRFFLRNRDSNELISERVIRESCRRILAGNSMTYLLAFRVKLCC